MIRILVVDDRIDFRMTFVSLLEGQPDLEVAGQAVRWPKPARCSKA